MRRCAATGRRRLPLELLAERVRISRSTLTKVEKGDESVALGISAAVFFVLGLVEGLGNLADAAGDTIGRAIDERNLPQRIRLPSATKRQPPSTPGTGGGNA